MAILQTRMIALINAATDYQQAFNTLCQFIHQQAQAIQDGLSTPEQAWLSIEPQASPRILLQRPTESASALAVEHYHFTKNARRNAYIANRAAAKRQKQGTPTRQPRTSPFATTDLFAQGAIRQPSQSQRGSFLPQPTTPTYQIDHASILAEVESTLSLEEQDALDDTLESTFQPPTPTKDPQ